MSHGLISACTLSFVLRGKTWPVVPGLHRRQKRPVDRGLDHWQQPVAGVRCAAKTCRVGRLGFGSPHDVSIIILCLSVNSPVGGCILILNCMKSTWVLFSFSFLSFPCSFPFPCSSSLCRPLQITFFLYFLFFTSFLPIHSLCSAFVYQHFIFWSSLLSSTVCAFPLAIYRWSF